MKKIVASFLAIAALLIPNSSNAALLSGPARLELTSGGSTITRGVTFFTMFSTPTSLRANIYLSGMSYTSFNSSSRTSLTATGFTLTINNGTPITASSADFAKDTTTGLSLDVIFTVPAGSICATTPVSLSLDSSAPQVPISDAANATIDSFTAALAPRAEFNQPLPACPSNQVVQSPGSPARASAPIKYSGPEFSELALKPALAGSSATLEGRKLDQISSVTIGGKAAVLSNATDKSVNIGLPAGLAPGVYDLVVTTANHGKLTHMNAIRIREVLPATSLTIQGTGVLSGEEFKKLTAFSRTQNPDMNTVTCIVNSNSEGKSFMQARALCDRIAATNLNVKTTMFETRSTVKSSAVFARVVFSSEE